MKLPENKSSDFQIAPAGNHTAVCFEVIDLGTQEVEWQGQKKQQRKVMIGWELPDERMDDRPFIISNRYTFSVYERAKFRQHLESWRGKKFEDSDFGPDGFDVKNLIGKGCLLNVIHTENNGKTYANISSIATMPKSMETPELENEAVYFSFEEYDENVLKSLPEWIQETISKSPEFQSVQTVSAQQSNVSQSDDLGDDVPF